MKDPAGGEQGWEGVAAGPLAHRLVSRRLVIEVLRAVKRAGGYGG